MPAIVVDRDEDLTLNSGNAVAYTVDFGADAPDAPADPGTAPSADWVPVGACDQTGLTEGFTMTTTNIMAIGIITPFRTLITEQAKTFKLVLLEAERDICVSIMFRQTLAAIARDVSSGLRAVEDIPTPAPDKRAWLFRMADGDSIQQVYAPVAEVTARSDVAYPQNDVAKYEITMTAYPDANGVAAYRLDNFPVTPAASNS